MCFNLSECVWWAQEMELALYRTPPPQSSTVA